MSRRSPHSFQRFMTFFLDSHLFAIPAVLLREISVLENIETPTHPFPRQIKIRDAHYPMIDLRQLFELPALNATEDSRVLIIESSRGRFGILVDSAERVESFPARMVELGARPLFQMLQSASAIKPLVIEMDLIACLAAPQGTAARHFSAATGQMKVLAS